MLFLRILGTIGMFIAVGLTLTAMIGMLNAKKTETLRIWANFAVKVDGLLPFSVIIIFLPALYLVMNAWDWNLAWINGPLAALIVISFMGPAINLRRLKLALKAANEEKSSTPSNHLMQIVRDRLLWTSCFTMSMIAVAIVFLMTVKPALIGTIIAFAAAILLGYIIPSIILKKVPSNI